MGMYTTIRASVVVKPEYRVVIARLHQLQYDVSPQDWRPGYCWLELAKEFPDLTFVDAWSQVGRCSFIPFGDFCGVPESFSPRGKWYTDFDHTSGAWSFCSSLKNYGGEIQFFVTNVLARIVESATVCDSRYEEADDHRDLLPLLGVSP